MCINLWSTKMRWKLTFADEIASKIMRKPNIPEHFFWCRNSKNAFPKAFPTSQDRVYIGWPTRPADLCVLLENSWIPSPWIIFAWELCLHEVLQKSSRFLKFAHFWSHILSSHPYGMTLKPFSPWFSFFSSWNCFRLAWIIFRFIKIWPNNT